MFTLTLSVISKTRRNHYNAQKGGYLHVLKYYSAQEGRYKCNNMENIKCTMQGKVCEI